MGKVSLKQLNSVRDVRAKTAFRWDVVEAVFTWQLKSEGGLSPGRRVVHFIEGMEILF